jgi:hypothetical protein
VKCDERAAGYILCLKAPAALSLTRSILTVAVFPYFVEFVQFVDLIHVFCYTASIHSRIVQYFCLLDL